ncbi:ROK family transcriptional regulator [Nocardioides albus]|uniref:Putative NBD/HSP70 family sugar kinase n=1 Tax=Nocardioides albus TaxID=1841 RepID=A0A7W5A1I4_9ACTN|nr:ROK family transcriptional regulator [Nocardioides albus]MBB3087931.1 putative NBD/HSP70 family sugar kinase [Nocardioides albus]GGU21395.1 sugar kinase [Nocardioides albus]
MGIGPGDILELVREDRATTRGEIAELTGLSRVTVAHRVDALLAAGLVEGVGSGSATGGRRPTRLAFNADAGRVAVAAIDTAHAEVAITDLWGVIQRRTLIDVDVAAGPVATLDRVAAALADVIDDENRGRPLGIGLSLPSPIDPATGRPSEPPILPGWDDFDIGAHLTGRRWGDAPVIVRNDADAMGYGEYLAVPDHPRSLFLLKASTGIGSGIIIEGHIYQGNDGAAGDIGHVRVPEAEGALCQCGATGCLAAIASGRAVARQLRELGRDAPSGRAVKQLLDQGDPDAVQVTRQAGRVIGRVLATVVTLVNPSVLVFGGDLASASLLSGVQESLYPAVLPRATRRLEIRLAELGDDSSLRGMAGQVVQQELSAEAVNTRLA